ncbi:MAG TPA: glycoside hydrolase family 3 protein, partial [Gemmatimonadaceae bacterium]|nr:glycoside hydrolase family 3 protein [Gemmatimonadaceae bacterium]
MSALVLSAVSLAAILLGTPPDTPDTSSVERALAELTLREKAAQMVMPWIPGGSELTGGDLRRAEQLVRQQRVGGFIVGKGEAAITARSLRRLQELSKVPLLIAADLESGPAMRLLGGSLFPSHMALGATRDTMLAYAQGRATALEGRLAGVHMAFAPVADVNVNPLNPIINTRSFGENPEQVAEMVAAFVRGLQDGGMLAVTKHFPGHGDTRTDSHLALPVVRVDRARLDSVELVPFRRAIAVGVAGVMTAHIALPRITGRAVPATLSRRITNDILRRDLGFTGLVVTDALNMAGVRGYEQPEIVLRAIEAGADILLQPTDTRLAVNAIVEGVRSGRISQARVDASARRILAAKARVDASRDDAVPADSLATIRAHHAALAAEINARAITLLRDERSAIPIPASDTIVSVVVGDGSARAPGDAFDRTLRASGRTVEAARVPSRARPVDLERATECALRDGRILIVSSYVQASPGRGAVGLPSRVVQWLKELSKQRPVIFVAFGDPYVARGLDSVPTVVMAWSISPSAQEAAARAVTGEAKII